MHPIIRLYEQNKTASKMELPKDPMMLYSVVNMKLRDSYASLDALCDDLQVNRSELERELSAVGFAYDKEQNRFW